MKKLFILTALFAFMTAPALAGDQAVARAVDFDPELGAALPLAAPVTAANAKTCAGWR